jgi:ribonuclease R
MARKTQLDSANLLKYLQVRGSAASFRDILRAMGLPKAERPRLLKTLAELKKIGLLEENPGGKYRAKAGVARTPDAVREHSQSSRIPKKQIPTSNRTAVSGRLVLHPDGYGFVVPDTPMPQLDGDIFIPRDAIEDAMHGDHVLVQLGRMRMEARGQRAEGRIVRILDRAHPTVVGLFRYGPRGNSVLPYDTRIQHEIEIPPGEELTAELRKLLGLAGARGVGEKPRRATRLAELDGAVVNVELLRYPKGGAAPVGRVVEIIGRPGELGVDTEIVIRKYHLPHTFSAEVVEDARNRAHAVQESDLDGREDFRDLPIVTIDGETARDFDDAVYAERRANGWNLQVHIADVAHYVRASAPLDNEARLRGTSVYFIDRAVPMLPETLSNGICSLNPREDRLVMSALMEFDAAGNMHGARFTPGVIRSAERMTYTNVNKVLEGEAEMMERYAALAPHFRDMRELAMLLNARRNEHGSIDFDLPEPVIEFDDEQRMTNISRSERNIAHRLIEEFMLAANRAVAGYLLRRGLAALHRVHEKPDARKVLEFEELARAFGYSLGVENLQQREIAVRHGRVPAPARAGRPDSYGHGREREMRVILPGANDLRITPQHYQRLVKKLAGKPEERIMSYLMLRSLKQARYAADSLGHFALGFDEYTHFTSPIRRYPDLIVHRILKWAIANPGSGPPREPRPVPRAEAVVYSHGQLEEIATETSEAERRAAAAERELRDWKTAQFMEEHLGDEYEGLIVSVQKYGCFVELFEVFVEGLLPIGALEEAAGAHCVYRERDHAIVALKQGSHRSGRSATSGKAGPLIWRLGGRVQVRAERIDPMRHRVEFALVEED